MGCDGFSKIIGDIDDLLVLLNFSAHCRERPRYITSCIFSQLIGTGSTRTVVMLR